MKTALSAGLVAALLYPPFAVAGKVCPKLARGSDRVLCHVVAPFSYYNEHHHHHHHKGKHKHKHKDKDLVRGVEIYAFSFLWNYVIMDDCSPTQAHLASVLPMLSNEPHQVICRLQVRWGQDKAGGPAENQTQSWDYVGQRILDGRSFPNKMEWPLPASYKSPGDLAAANDWGVKYESAPTGEAHSLTIVGGSANDFSHSWGATVHGSDGHPGYPGGQGFHGLQGYQGHEGNDGHDDKHGHKHKHKKDYDRTFHSYGRLGGHYNTKKLFSCWEFEKFHLRTEHQDGHHHHHHHHHHGKSGKDEGSKGGFFGFGKSGKDEGSKGGFFGFGKSGKDDGFKGGFLEDGKSGKDDGSKGDDWLSGNDESGKDDGFNGGDWLLDNGNPGLPFKPDGILGGGLSVSDNAGLDMFIHPDIPFRPDFLFANCEPVVPPLVCHERKKCKGSSCGSGKQSGNECEPKVCTAEKDVGNKCKQQCGDDVKSDDGSKDDCKSPCTKQSDKSDDLAKSDCKSPCTKQSDKSEDGSENGCKPSCAEQGDDKLGDECSCSSDNGEAEDTKEVESGDESGDEKGDENGSEVGDEKDGQTDDEEGKEEDECVCDGDQNENKEEGNEECGKKACQADNGKDGCQKSC